MSRTILRLFLLGAIALQLAATVIDCGTPAGDQYAAGGAPWLIPQALLPPGSTDATLRYGTSFSYHIPIAPGTYSVTLRFQEPALPGSDSLTLPVYQRVSPLPRRVFNVSLNGALVIDQLDLFAVSGILPYSQTFQVPAPTGFIDVLLVATVRSAVISAIEVTPVLGQQINTSNTAVLSYPPLPVLPAAGGVFVDPTFGTRLLRVTDLKDGLGCGTAYSYWPTFNRNSTRLIASCSMAVSTWIEPTAIFYSFDPTNLKISAKIVKTSANSRTPTGEYVDLSGAIWSGQDPDVLFAVHPTTAKIWAYNVAKDSYRHVKDFAVTLPGKYLWQIHRSLDDDKFSFTIRNKADYSTSGYAVYSVSADKLIYTVNTTSIDEVQIDKTGNYLVVKTGESGTTVVEGRVVDLKTGIVTDLLDGAPDFNLGHSDNGEAIQIGEENWTPAILRRDLSNPHKAVSLLDETWATGAGGHYSLLSDAEDWALISNAETQAQPKVRMEGELWLLATDGSQRVKRFAHPRSVYKSYYDFPRANLSRDGNYAAFTSNWGGSARSDLFVVEIVRAPIAPTSTKTCFSLTIENDGAGNITKRKNKQTCTSK